MEERQEEMLSTVGDMGWKTRANAVMPTYNSTTRENKVCKKCGQINSFFKIECEKCKVKFNKLRTERGVQDKGSGLNPINTASMNTDNYPIFFWDLLQHTSEYFSQYLAQLISEELTD